MNMSPESVEARKREWDEICAGAEGFTPKNRVFSSSLASSEEAKTLRSRLEAITVQVAEIGKTEGRARVRRGETELFDTGTCSKAAMRTKLVRFLAGQILLEASRYASEQR